MLAKSDRVTDLVQLLTPEGERIDHPGYPFEISAEEARALFRDMTLVRRLDLEAMALQRQGELGLWAPLLGQEAAQIGTARALRPEDFVFPSYREHGFAYCRGIPPANLLELWRCTSYSGWDAEKFRMAGYTLVIGAHTLQAVGYAMGVQRDGAAEAVLACFGDGATSQGDVNEAFVWAAAQNAPVVFLCQNNHWAISAPTETQARVPIYRRAAGFGFPGVRVDGNDVFASLAVARTALERARAGEGPTLIEADTYRMSAHTSSDDPKRYRADAEVEEWRLKDPIERLRLYLTKNELAGEDFFTALDAEADELGARVRAECRALPDPDPREMFDHVYADAHAQLAEERAAFLAYLDTFAD
ncbi:pyruvate dehydrogenase (acetyl-transferring) E1 component subunit alpha [Actinoallomurus soli]|uniref:pyruvate dehydrogenase (acetyl-transferring) E1 component subunit alpha n=1 Tax=Actinoallomurus soli TaxID=2952535 RepID=UPI0020938627|nr:pyruvate dehydrogenase (acetyl-transferring) E1 component subunit alpha [Actinoallomurus soli]MCO5969633.1 pyruvate dehydrogenase (acetyl-transferring) E1 component subunit alpha [Actinoallomurus soli]